MKLKSFFPVTVQNHFGTGRTIGGRNQQIVCVRHLDPVGKNVAFQTVDATQSGLHDTSKQHLLAHIVGDLSTRKCGTTNGDVIM